jgi:hypothetical protein
MRANYLKMAALVAVTMSATFVLTSCGGSKKMTQQHTVSQQTVSTEAVMDIPCFQPDDDEWYTGTVARRSPVGRTNTLATACLRAARQNLQQKIKGRLKQVTRDYFNQMDIDEGSNEASHIESASDYIVDQFMNDMLETCRKITQPDAQGMVTMYIGVKISKAALVDNLANGLSKDKQLELRFEEKTFRDDAFKVFSEDKQQSFDDYKNSKEQ